MGSLLCVSIVEEKQKGERSFTQNFLRQHSASSILSFIRVDMVDKAAVLGADGLERREERATRLEWGERRKLFTRQCGRNSCVALDYLQFSGLTGRRS
jgi:hypothetical protein